METYLKERLVGAGVLILLAVIFIPMFLSDEPVTLKQEPAETVEVETPSSDHQSSVVPVEEPKPVIKEVISETKQELPSGMAEQATQKKTADVIAEETVEKSQKENVAKTTATPARNDVGSTQAWVVQLGSFSSEENAQVLNKRLLKHKYPSFVEPLVREDKVVYRVRVGPSLQKSKIEKLKSDIQKKLKLNGILVKYP